MTIERLRRIAARAGEAMGDDGLWLAAAIEDFLDKHELTPIERRNEAICHLADDLHPGTTHSGKVAAVRAMIRRYRTGRWQRSDRWRETMPPMYTGKPEQWLFEAFHAVDGKVPSSPKQVGRVLLSHGNHKRIQGHFAMSILLDHDGANHEG